MLAIKRLQKHHKITFSFKKPAFFAGFLFQPDYTGMRIITDKLYAALIAHLAKDEKVSLFQQLLLSKQADDTALPDSDDEGGAE